MIAASNLAHFLHTMTWPEATVVIVALIVLGWIVDNVVRTD